MGEKTSFVVALRLPKSRCNRKIKVNRLSPKSRTVGFRVPPATNYKKKIQLVASTTPTLHYECYVKKSSKKYPIIRPQRRPLKAPEQTWPDWGDRLGDGNKIRNSMQEKARHESFFHLSAQIIMMFSWARGLCAQLAEGTAQYRDFLGNRDAGTRRRNEWTR